MFRAGDRDAARSRLGLSREADVLLLRRGVFATTLEDTRRCAVQSRIGGTAPSTSLIFLLSWKRAPENCGNPKSVLSSWKHLRVAEYYQAAYIYIPASRATLFPLQFWKRSRAKDLLSRLRSAAFPNRHRRETECSIPPGVRVRWLIQSRIAVMSRAASDEREGRGAARRVLTPA